MMMMMMMMMMMRNDDDEVELMQHRKSLVCASKPGLEWVLRKIKETKRKNEKKKERDKQKGNKIILKVEATLDTTRRRRSLGNFSSLGL